MKCDVIYTHAKQSNTANSDDELKQLRGRGFKDEREYLAFLLEQERIWEQENIDPDNDTNDTE